MNKPTKDQKPEVPRLAQEIKNLNGKSGKKLSKCIETLCEIIDEEEPKRADSEGQAT